MRHVTLQQVSLRRLVAIAAGEAVDWNGEEAGQGEAMGRRRAASRSVQACRAAESGAGLADRGGANLQWWGLWRGLWRELWRGLWRRRQCSLSSPQLSSLLLAGLARLRLLLKKPSQPARYAVPSLRRLAARRLLTFLQTNHIFNHDFGRALRHIDKRKVTVMSID